MRRKRKYAFLCSYGSETFSLSLTVMQCIIHILICLNDRYNVYTVAVYKHAHGKHTRGKRSNFKANSEKYRLTFDAHHAGKTGNFPFVFTKFPFPGFATISTLFSLSLSFFFRDKKLVNHFFFTCENTYIRET